MAQLTWKTTLSKWLNKINNMTSVPPSRAIGLAPNRSVATDSAKPPEWYLDLAAECMERVQEVIVGGVSTTVKLNHRQCEYLAEKLETSMKKSRMSLMRSSSPEHKAECLETVKLLHRLSVQVERFVEDCCKGDWMQSAMTWASVPARVSSLGYYLELCTELLRINNKLGAASLAWIKLEGLRQAEFHSVEERASLDRDTLIKSLINVLSKSKRKRFQLATIVLERLEAVETMPTAGSSASSHGKFSFANSGNTSIKVVQEIGRGLASTVFRGIWMGAPVAVKVFPGDDTVKFEKEVSIMEGLCHPNLVNLLGYAYGREELSMVLELMERNLFDDLDTRMRGSKEKTPFTIWEGVDLMLQVAEGVNYLHQKNIIHGELNSRNILVKLEEAAEMKMEFLHAKVGYFGLSKTILGSTCSNLTQNVGTTRWMAPELIRVGFGNGFDNGVGNGVLKRPFKTDVFSFAMVCYEILTADIPFSSLFKEEAKAEVLAGNRPLLPAECPQDLKSLIEMCWDPQPEHRPSFSTICEELRYIKCSLLLEPLDLTRTHEPDQAVASVDLPGLSHMKINYSCLERGIQLGKGGSETIVYSTTWCRAKGAEDVVAQKFFFGANNEEFVKEATTLAGLNHAKIIRLLGYATNSRSCCIVMERMDGDLRDLIRERRIAGSTTPTGPFSMDEGVDIMLQVAEGMHYVHVENVAHRDLKSCNILVRSGAKSVKQLDVKVADFGLSEKKSEDGSFGNVSYNVGTLRWMAPEVMKLKDGEDIRASRSQYDLLKSDVYSFAMVCFEILTGAVPFADISLELKKDESEVLKKKVLDGERPLLPEYCPPSLKAVIESCWDGDAGARPSFDEICVDLKRLVLSAK